MFIEGKWRFRGVFGVAGGIGLMGDHGSHTPGVSESVQVMMARSGRSQTILEKRCTDENTRFRTAPLSVLRSDVLDLSALHSRLYDGLCSALPQAVGTFRGTPGTPVEFAKRAVKTRGKANGLRQLDACLDPAEVVRAMTLLQSDLAAFWGAEQSPDPIKTLADFTHQFFWVHPFIDGNGHVWRLIVIALARRAGMTAREHWTIAKRPYGASFSYALQNHTKMPRLLKNELLEFFQPSLNNL